MSQTSADAEPTAKVLGGLNDVEQRHAPRALYLAGDRKLLEHCRVSVVGTRKPTELGQRRTEKLVTQLVADEIVVVSGLAAGVDTVAHTTALRVGGRTIAVLGTPLDVSYPIENAALQQHIIRDHLAISQFAPGTPTSRKNFPQRNRTMALCSDATVIIEAGESSGTWSQGWEALRLGRPLFLANSLAKRVDLEPVRELLKYGAQPLLETAQLLEQLPPPGLWGSLVADF